MHLKKLFNTSCEVEQKFKNKIEELSAKVDFFRTIGLGIVEAQELIENRIEKLERTSIEIRPHKCPVCNGFGRREDYSLGVQINNPTRVIQCGSCEGKGIIWE